VDDDTCDEGATATTALRFMIADTDEAALSGAVWSIRDVDATNGTLSETVVASGTTASDGYIDAVLDCADGWMLLEVAHSGNLTLHAYFLVYPVDDWQLVAMSESLASFAIGLSISSGDEGLLAVYKIHPDGTPDLQSDDSFTIDEGPNLVPSGADGNLGMWIYDGAYTSEMFDIWFVSADVPDAETVARLEYHDASSGLTTLLYAPIWSYGSGGAHHMTVFHSVY
jgi:hypothetical protein